jgi:DNA-binding NarL/FixJ family response regulator
VVILTSSVEERDVLASYQLGVNSYVVKPVDFNSFVDEVSKTGCYWLLVNRVPNQI